MPNTFHSNNLKVEIVNPLDVDNWDDLLQTNNKTTFFHTSEWAKVLSKSYKYKPLYFLITEDDHLTSLIPMMEIRSFLTGVRGVSLPFSDECSPIFKNKIQKNALLDVLKNYGKKANWKYYELRGGEPFFVGEPCSSRYYSHTLDLSTETETIFSKLKSSTKRNIKKSIREGVNCSIVNTQNAKDDFVKLNNITRKLHGLPPQPNIFFNMIFDSVIKKKLGDIFLATHNGKVVAAAMFFCFKDTAIYKFGASDRKFQKLRANNLVMWEAIKNYAAKGQDILEFGRTETTNKGLLQYKRGWCKREKIIKYYNYDLKESMFCDKQNTIKSSYNIASKLPIFLLRGVGKILYRHVG